MIDPINALACGGAEAPFNMQWQSVAEGKAKDKWEGKLWSYILNIGVTGHSGLLTPCRVTHEFLRLDFFVQA